MRKEEDELVDIPELIGMISQDGEEVPFSKPLKLNAQRGVEVWLGGMLDEMTKIVRNSIQKASHDLSKETDKRQDLVKK